MALENLNGQYITNVRYPTSNDDAANKQYVDQAFAAGGATRLVLTQGTITDPATMIDGTVTWSDAADTFTAWKLNVTNTNSAAASLLLDLEVGSASKFVVRKDGAVGVNTNAPGAPSTTIWFDVFGWGLLIGADDTAVNAITRTNANNKVAAVVGAHSTNAEEPVCMIACASGGGANNVAIGGSLGQYNAATAVALYAAAGVTTVTGTQVALAKATGFIVGNTQTSLGRMHVVEDNALAGAAFPNIYGAVTWNNVATTHIGWQLTVTDTNSAAASLLLDMKIGANSVFKVVKTGSVIANSNTAIPAGGTAGVGVMVSSTANFGVFFGSGAPSLNAAKGSLYLRSDGSSNVTRAYINTDGAGTWTAINTVA